MRALLARYYEDPLVRLFDKLGFSPNGVTFLGLLIILIASVFVSQGHFILGSLLILLGGALDLIDGGLARHKGQVSKFGALLDSVVDRFQEASVFFSLSIYYLFSNCNEYMPFSSKLFESFSNSINTCDLGVLFAYTAFVASVMVSYLRARAEGLGIECKVGMMTRPERVIAVAVGIFVSHWFSLTIIVILALMTLLGFVTVIQRIIHSAKGLK
jgi:CDP-diacylglycerol--glycerol-3-phosphate 3-phosphatidyltransferase